MRRPALVVGLLILVAALVFGILAFKGSLIDTVSYADATDATDATVQIVGSPIPGTLSTNPLMGDVLFKITDGSGNTMQIAYHGPKPEDLDTAMSKDAKITVQGTYDANAHQFDADTLLVKCPSKYQGSNQVDRTYKAAT